MIYLRDILDRAIWLVVCATTFVAGTAVGFLIALWAGGLL